LVGHYEDVFVIFSFLLAVNSFLNILSVPAYFSYLGIGELKWNTLGHVIPAVMNVGLGFVFGYFYGGMAVVVAWILSAISGSVIIAVSYHFRYKIPLSELIPTQSRKILLACMFSIFITFLLYHQLDRYFNFVNLTTFILLIFFALVIPFIWYHPMRKRLTSLVANELLNRSAKL
jgi:O-antigen/teichoic acid export membrane protein